MLSRSFLITVLLLCLVSVGAYGENNPYGVHTMLQDFGHYPTIDEHLTWAKTLVGEGGYVKQLIYPITNSTTGPLNWWIYFADQCYDLNLNPIFRLGLTMGGPQGFWQKPEADAPGDYTTISNVIKNIVSQLPRRDGHTLFIEVLNEPNLRVEWSGEPNPMEYADFFIQVSAAIRSLGDPRIKILNGALSPGGDYNNLDFIDAMCTYRPEFTEAFDIWATHPYATVPPEQNWHDGTTTSILSIDSYMLELERLSKYMDISDLKVIATEAGFGGEGYPTADNMMRAFRDYYSKWPEVLAVCPWDFASPFGDAHWIYGDSETDENGYPTHATLQYHYVYNLAKPNMTTGAISGRIIEGAFETWLEGATVTLQPGNVTIVSDPRGIYMFPELQPGTYSITVSLDGYYTQTIDNLIVVAADNTVLDVPMQAEGYGVIQGTVAEGRSGNSLQGVSIVTTPGEYTATSGHNGSYNMFNINPGTYSALATKRFHYPHNKGGISVTSGQTTSADFWLGRGGDPGMPNMLHNPGLEGESGGSVAPHWSTNTGQSHPSIFVLDVSTKYAGDTSQRINVTTSDRYIWQMTNYNSITPGEAYLIQVRCKTSSVVTGAYDGAAIHYNFFTNANEWRGGGTIPGSLSGTNDWTLLRGTMVAPPGSQRMQVIIIARGNSGTAWFDQIYAGRLDTELPNPPTDVQITDPETGTELDLSWTHSTDSDLAFVRIYRSTTPGQLGALLHDQITAEFIQDTGLNPGTIYYYTFRSVDYAGNESDNTDQHSIAPIFEGPSIASFKNMPDYTEVNLISKVVSAGSDQLHNTIYVQDLDRVSGIKAFGDALGTNITAGSLVNLTGVLRTSHGERVILTPEVAVLSTGLDVVPILMTNQALGGGDLNELALGITGAPGLNNIGLLVTIYGRVTHSGSTEFYIDDGSGIEDGSGRIGVRVLTSSLVAGNTISSPPLNSFVKVTGISTMTRPSADVRVRVLRPRDQADIIVTP